MSTFAVGEVAIFWMSGDCYHLAECTIVGPLHFSVIVNTNTEEVRQCDVYDIQFLDGLEAPSPPGHLRKRRPPQDWQQLCKLDEVPAEAKSTEVA
jgi:hypothetical protein